MNRIRQGLLVTALCLVVTSCDRSSKPSADARWIELEGTRIEYAHKVELAKLKLERQEASRPAADGTGIEDVEALRTQVTQLKALKDSLQTNLTNAEITALDRYRTHVETVRAKAVGKEYPTFQTAGGRTYENAKVAAVTDDGVKLVHASGIARLNSSDLSEAQRALFGLDEAFESAAQDRRNDQELAYHRWVDRQLAAEAPKREAEITRKTDAAEALAKIAAIQPRVTTQANLSPLQRPATSVSDSPKYRVRSRRTYNYYPAATYYRPSYSYQIYSTPRSAPSISLPGSGYCRPIITPSLSRPNQ